MNCTVQVSWADCQIAEHYLELYPATVLEYTVEISPETEVLLLLRFLVSPIVTSGSDQIVPVLQTTRLLSIIQSAELKSR